MRKYLYLLLLLFAAATPANAKWREASSDNFLIYSESSSADLEKLATQLESYYAALGQLYNVHKPPPGLFNRLTVYVLSDWEVHNLAGMNIKGGGTVAGLYVGRAFGSIALTSREKFEDGYGVTTPQVVLFHECAHHFMAQNFKGVMPAWFTEGFAEFASTAAFNSNGAIRLGVPARHRTAGRVLGPRISLTDLLTSDGRTINPDLIEAFYIQAWGLTHYMTVEPSRRGQLETYLQLMDTGQNSLDAAREAFGDLNQLAAQLQRYILPGSKKVYIFSPDQLQIGKIASRELGPAEEAVMRVRIRLARGGSAAQAAWAFEEARVAATRYPDDPAVQRALSAAALEVGQFVVAETAANQVLATHPRSIDALIDKGRAKSVGLVRSGARAPTAWVEVQELYRRANQIDPSDPRPMILMYDSYATLGIVPPADVSRGLFRALDLVPQDDLLRLKVVRQHLLDGDGAEARTALVPLAYDSHAGEIARFATSLLAALDQSGSQSALKAWQSLAGSDSNE